MHRSTSIAICLLVLGCGLPELSQEPDAQPPVIGPPAARDGGKRWWTDGGPGRDDAGFGARDAGPVDAGNAPRADSGMVDSGRADAGRADAGSADAGPADAGGIDSGPADGGRDAGSSPGALAPVFGVTITDPWVAGTPAGATLLGQLRALRSRSGRRPMARVVFDAGVDRVRPAYDVDASDYADHVRAIGAEARVMGELLDSYYVRDYSLAQYRARACEYRAELGHLVDVWEIGNEVNGEWLGAGVMEKILAAIEVFRATPARFAALCPGLAVRSDERPIELALTLYYNGEHEGGRSTATNCWERADNAMQHWVTTHFGPGGDAAHVRGDLEHVLVSYYEDDCNDLQPRWQDVFDRLGAVFDTSALGIGECGTTALARKGRYVERYYRGVDSADPAFANMRVIHPRYVGGFFWWYLSDDLGVPAVTNGLEAALDDPFWLR